MISGGYVLQPRCYDGSDISKMPPCTREVWFWLCRNATRKKYGSLDVGEIVCTLEQISKSLGWSVGYRQEGYSKPQITKALRRLREGNAVETTKVTHGILVRVLNYAYYQDPENYEGNGEGITKESRRSSGGHNKNKREQEEQEKQSSNEKTKKEFTPKPEVVEIIEYFNKHGKTDFKPTKTNCQHISGRLRDGFGVEDLKKVTYWVCKTWPDDDFFCQWFPRLDTPFRKKAFDGRLKKANMWAERNGLTKNGKGKALNKNLSVCQEWMEEPE